MEAAAGRTVDKFGIVFDHMNQDVSRKISLGSHYEEYILIRCQGDGFLDQQVTKMVGTAIAIYKGYLPEYYTDFVYDSNNIIDVPSSPDEFLYLKQCRYGFHTHTRSLFAEEVPTFDQDFPSSDPIRDVAAATEYATILTHEICSTSSFSSSGCETWLRNIELQCRDIKSRMEQIENRRKSFSDASMPIGEISKSI